MTILKRIPAEVYLIVSWFICIIVVNPIGEFPLNDDWAYAKSVLNLCEKGNLTMDNWPAMTLIGQVLYSSLFCKLFGFSFFSLRLTTLIVGLLGILTFYKFALFFNTNKKIAILAALVIMVNPLFFSLSFTFMTDVHFFSFLMFSLYLFCKYLKSPKIRFVIFATLFSIISTMIRQPGVVAPFAFMVAIFIKTRKRIDLLKYSIPFFITASSLIIHNYWFKYHSPTKSNFVGFNDLIELLSSLDFYKYMTISCKTLLYIGLFLVPFFLLFLHEAIKIIKSLKPVQVIISLLIPIVVLLAASTYPIGNILYNFGLGPKLLKDAYWKYNIHPQINNDAWLAIVKVMSVIGCMLFAIFILYKINGFIKKRRRDTPHNINAPKLCTLLVFLGYFFLLLINTSYFDRYTIPLIAMSILLLLPLNYKVRHKKKIPGAIIFAAFTFFSIGATHDYLSWNRCRWEAIEYLVQEKNIDRTEIDGGFEFNAWYKTGPWSKVCKECKSWWFVAKDNYVISFGDIKGFAIMETFHYPKILSLGHGNIYILRKDGQK